MEDLMLNQSFETHDLILRCLAQQGLEGRSSARHPSFEAPLRCAPQDEVEER